MTLSGFFELFSSVIPYKIKPWAWKDEKWTSKDIPDDINGKVAVVTGANGGVGLQTTFELFRKGAHVLMGCRSEAKFEVAKATILSRLEPEEQRGKLSYLKVDTSTIRSSQLAAHDVLRRADIDRLDIFVACAGKGSGLGPLTEDGVEPFMATNCLGHLALLQLLLPIIIKTTHFWSSLIWPFIPKPTFTSWDEVNNANLGEQGLYSRSKLAQILTMKRLDRDLAKENISCLAIHPGELDNRFVEKMMPSPIYPYIKFVLRLVLLNEHEGARTCLFAATSREVDQRSLHGVYITYPAHVTEPSQLARDRKLSDTIWSLQMDLIQKHSQKNN